MTFDQGAGEASLIAARYIVADMAWYLAGLHVTWPTSYEALVGRAELKPGKSMKLEVYMALADSPYA